MDFDWDDEQQTYRETVVRFARRELGEELLQRDHHSAFSREAWRRCADFGIQGLPVPEEYGGSGADTMTVVAALEALGYGCRDNGLLFSLNAHMWACAHPITRFGTEDQKRRYLPGLCDGSLVGAHAMSEPGSGSDAFSLTTTAAETSDGYVLNGSKTFVTNAPEADVLVLFATTDKSKGFAGLCGFVIDRDTPGLEVGEPLHKMGLRTSPMAEVFLDDCRVPRSALLGPPGGGMAVFNSAMERERSLILACTVGSMERLVEEAVAYAKERNQFGQPIGKFQAVSHRIVDMKLRLETARLLLYRLAWSIDRGRRTGLDTALTKLWLSESFVDASMGALLVRGGYGYMSEYEVERDVRDAIGSQLYSGTSDIQRNLAARLLGL